MLTAKHISTLQERLGGISAILDDQYLPMFRNRQINYPELWEFSVKLAEKKDNPGHYLAHIWGRRNLDKTIDWLTKLFEGAKTKIIAVAHAIKQKLLNKKADKLAEQPMNREMRRRFDRMKLDKLAAKL